MGKESLIFCQAPTKIPYVLACYSRLKKTGMSVRIFVLNAPLVFEFLKSLHLDCSVDFITIPMPVNKYLFLLPVTVWRFWRWVCRSEFYFMTDVDIYFSCIAQDPACHILLKYLSRRNSIIYMRNPIDILSTRTDRGIPTKVRIKHFIYRIFYRTNFVFYRQEYYALGIPVEAVRTVVFSHEELRQAIAAFSHRVAVPPNQKCAAFFANPYRDPYTTPESYVSCHIEVARRLKAAGWYLVGKGHPRLGFLSELQPYMDEMIGQSVPAEFLDLSNVKACIGLTTTSICASAVAGVPSFSFLPLVKVINQETYDYWTLYLKNNSEGKIIYINCLDDICKI